MSPVVDLLTNMPCNPEYGDPCPEGQKCVPYSLEEWGEFECVPVLGDGQHGDPCVIDWPESNLDDCGSTSWCFMDVCSQFCDVENGCPDNSRCLSSEDINPFVCIDQCDAVAQDCPPGQACYLTLSAWGFQCSEQVDGIGLGEPCTHGSECKAGLWCIEEDYYPGGCGGHAHEDQNKGCCAPWCDESSDEDTCPLALAGTTCGGSPYDAPYYGLSMCAGPSFAAGELQIVEVAADPPGLPIYEAPLEYVELINLSDRELELGFLAVWHAHNEFGKAWLSDAFEVMSGDGGCVEGGPQCLAPGRRALLVIDTYVGETGDALVLSIDDVALFGGIFQPFTQVFVMDIFNQAISSYRDWDDPSGEPLPVNEQPLHRIDFGGADVPENWSSGPASPGL